MRVWTSFDWIPVWVSRTPRSPSTRELLQVRMEPATAHSCAVLKWIFGTRWLTTAMSMLLHQRLCGCGFLFQPDNSTADSTHFISWFESADSWLDQLCVLDLVGTKTCSHATIGGIVWISLSYFLVESKILQVLRKRMIQSFYHPKLFESRFLVWGIT